MPLAPTFNGFVYNGNLYNGAAAVEEVFSTDLVVFERFSLADNVNVVCTHLLDSGPTRELIGGSIPRYDGTFVTADYYRERIIEVRGIVQANTAAALDALLDTMRKKLRTREGSLDITRNGAAKRYVATLMNYDELFADRDGYHITFCPFVARFSCRTPFGTDRTYSSEFLTLTASPTNQVAVNAGTIHTQPVCELIFTAVSSVTTVNVKRVDGDGKTLDEIEYVGSIAANDILIFDSEEKEVTKNGSPQEYTGGFPVLEPDSNIIQVTINGTFSADTTIRWKNAYL